MSTPDDFLLEKCKEIAKSVHLAIYSFYIASVNSEAKFNLPYAQSEEIASFHLGGLNLGPKSLPVDVLFEHGDQRISLCIKVKSSSKKSSIEKISEHGSRANSKISPTSTVLDVVRASVDVYSTSMKSFLNGFNGVEDQVWFFYYNLFPSGDVYKLKIFKIKCEVIDPDNLRLVKLDTKSNTYVIDSAMEKRVWSGVDDDLKNIYFQNATSKIIYKLSSSKGVVYRHFEYKDENLIYQEDLVKPSEESIAFLKGNVRERQSEDQARVHFNKNQTPLVTSRAKTKTIILPLYSSNKDGKFVPEKSGLNQWNAGGRPRKHGEAYIGLSEKTKKAIARVDREFFPQDTFTCVLPSGETMSLKVCQQGGKALMSNPNVDLFNWLSSVLVLPKERIVTYDDLVKAGQDCVRIEKNSNGYQLSLGRMGEYEKFLKKYTPKS